jgi:hypothetical protein
MSVGYPASNIDRLVSQSLLAKFASLGSLVDGIRNLFFLREPTGFEL